jgi:hypothetical protein
MVSDSQETQVRVISTQWYGTRVNVVSQHGTRVSVVDGYDEDEEW